LLKKILDKLLEILHRRISKNIEKGGNAHACMVAKKEGYEGEGQVA